MVTSPDACQFIEEYYKSGNYSDYVQRGPRYSKLVREIDHLLDAVCLKDKDAPTLDFGCAIGHVVRALTEDFSYTDVVGYDISEWAVQTGNKILRSPLLTNSTDIFQKRYHLTFALDVFEHMTIDSIHDALTALSTRYLIVRIPVGNDGKFFLNSANQDETHVTCMTHNQWRDLFQSYGFEIFFKINLCCIWDSEGVFAAVLREP